jgi:hypothetical protein
MKPQLFPALYLLSALGLAIGLPTGTPAPLQAQAPMVSDRPEVIAATKTIKPLTIPTALSNQVLETMAGTLGGDRKQFTIGKITPATWQDCATAPDRDITGDCAPQPRSGWRVQAKGKGETWQYFVTSAGNVTLDGVSSVSAKVKTGLAKALNRDVTTLRFQAVQPVQNMAGCPVTALCKMAANPAWKILLDDAIVPYTVTLQGTLVEDASFASFLPPNLVGMPASYGEAVLRDVRDRADGMLTQNFRVVSLKAINWNECRGGNPAPSQPARGICPDIDRRGWQMITANGSVRWVHYLLKSDVMPPTLDRVSPDGPQSLPKSMGIALLRLLAKREGKLLSNYRVYWADATFFDGCLNPVMPMQSPDQPNRINPALGCRQRVQSGWQVSVMGNEISGGGTPLTTYYVNGLGTDYRLISQTQWFPPPVAPPPGR